MDTMKTQSFAISILSLIPFALMLLSIALFPLFANRFWEKNRNKLIIAAVLSLPVLLMLMTAGQGHRLFETLVFDYIPFIVLLGALFTITGGIYLSGDIEAKPLINTAFLGIGAILASFMGTTGAAMLLIRPVIQTNKERQFKVHTILFFIAIIANCGGLLTPLGDPPLFMMYLRGAHFTWFLKLLPEWFCINAVLLVIYFVTDIYYYKKESVSSIARDTVNIRPLKIQGKLNFLWLVGVVLAVAFLNEQYLPFIKHCEGFKFTREAVILLMAGCSLLFTTHLTRVSNNFTWEPIKEVAYLFLGIFVTMVPCLIFLESNAKQLGITLAHQFYYATGALSSFLDNTPTAVTFHSLASGLGITQGTFVAGIPEDLLKAISVSAVVFGSMTYIGNGPNFMVKAVAEENNIRMPGFFSYIYRFSLIILLPLFIAVQLIFVR